MFFSLHRKGALFRSHGPSLLCRREAETTAPAPPEQDVSEGRPFLVQVVRSASRFGAFVMICVLIILGVYRFEARGSG